MFVRTLIALCIIIVMSSFCVLANLGGMRKSVDDETQKAILAIVDTKLIEYHCNTNKLPASMTDDFRRMSGLSHVDISQLVYTRVSEHRYNLSYRDSKNTVNYSDNSVALMKVAKDLPSVPGYVDRTLNL